MKLPFFTSSFISTIWTLGRVLDPTLVVSVRSSYYTNNLYTLLPALAIDSRLGVALPSNTGHL